MRKGQIVSSAGEVEKAGCVVLRNDEILLVANGKRGEYALPKGHVESNETPEATAVRETREETGYTVELVRYIGDMTYINQQTNEPIRVHYYLAKPLRDNHDAEDYTEWVSLKKAKGLVSENVKQFLDKVIS